MIIGITVNWIYRLSKVLVLYKVLPESNEKISNNFKIKGEPAISNPQIPLDSYQGSSCFMSLQKGQPCVGGLIPLSMQTQGEPGSCFGPSRSSDAWQWAGVHTYFLTVSLFLHFSYSVTHLPGHIRCGIAGDLPSHHSQWSELYWENRFAHSSYRTSSWSLTWPALLAAVHSSQLGHPHHWDKPEYLLLYLLWTRKAWNTISISYSHSQVTHFSFCSIP